LHDPYHREKEKTANPAENCPHKGNKKASRAPIKEAGREYFNKMFEERGLKF